MTTPTTPALLAIYRDIFAEITAKAIAQYDDTADPEKVTGYTLPVGPIHRAAGKLDFQMFNGEAHLRRAVERIDEIEAALARPSPPSDAIAKAYAVCVMVTKASMCETRPSRGESFIGWQAGDGGSAAEILTAARVVIAAMQPVTEGGEA